MAYKFKLIFFLNVLLYLSPILFFNSHIARAQEDLQDVAATLDWTHGPGIVYHSNQATIDLTSDESSVSGSDASKIMSAINDGIPFETELFIEKWSGDTYQGYITYNYYDSGYVKLDEWEDVKPDEFLKEKKESVKAQNKQIIANGSQNIITDVEWITEPSLDRNQNTVYYAINYIFAEGGPSINATTLILGRHGYTDATLVMSPEDFLVSGNQNLTFIRNNYKYLPQKEYSKFTTGDKVAAVGIGGLLATSLGIKAFKAGGLAALLIFAKKFAFLLLIPFIFAFSWIKNLFTRK